MTIVHKRSMNICCWRSIHLSMNAVWSQCAQTDLDKSSQWPKSKPYSSQLSPARSLVILRSIKAFFLGIPNVFFYSRVLSDVIPHINNKTNSRISEYHYNIHIGTVTDFSTYCCLYAFHCSLKQITSSLFFGCIIWS